MSALFEAVAFKLALLWFAFRHRATFRKLGAKGFLFRPYRIEGGGGIELGCESSLQRGGWLYCGGVANAPAVLKIGDGCLLGYNNHITAVREVVIGNHVLTANNVYITDNLHGYEDISRPIMHQAVRFKGVVSIGDGSWIGENACIIGARIGKHCVIGANAVVTRDIPDYSVAVGIPAVVIKRFDKTAGRWLDAKPA